jgi:hypothetical protein
MPSRQRVDIRNQERLLDDFFKIDKYEVSHEKYDGGMSDYDRRSELPSFTPSAEIFAVTSMSTGLPPALYRRWY